LVRALKKTASGLLEGLFFRRALKASANAQRSVRPASFLQLFFVPPHCGPIPARSAA
jgi:hypothetical protein